MSVWFSFLLALIGGYIIYNHLGRKSPQLLRSLLIFIAITVLVWLNSPMISILPENAKFNNILFEGIYKLYELSHEGYVLVSGLIIAFFIYKLENITVNNILSSKQVNKEFEKFIQDASELYIIGKDIDFLKNSNKQLNKMEELKSNCKILCSGSEDSKLIDIYDRLMKKRVDIRKYNSINSDKILNLRGQLKYTPQNGWRALFVQKTNKTNFFTSKSNDKFYEKIDIEDQFLISSLVDKFISIHTESTNPIIKYIVLDLGGVYFDGDYKKDFIDRINNILGLNLEYRHNDKLVLSEDLNLGKIDIVTYVEKEITKQRYIKSKPKLKVTDKQKIKDVWSEVWKPNKYMRSLMNVLSKMGYKIILFSNLDKENGDKYLRDEYFDKFVYKRFFSYKDKMLKPDEKYFKFLQDDIKCKSCEILIIDDREENINMAKSLSWNTLQFKISDGVENLARELKSNYNIQFVEASRESIYKNQKNTDSIISDLNVSNM